MGKIATAVKKLVKGDKGEKEAPKAPSKDSKQTQLQVGLSAIDREEKQYLTRGAISHEEAEKVAAKIKKDHPIFTSISVKDGTNTWDYEFSVQRGKKTGEKKEELQWSSPEVRSAAKRLNEGATEVKVKNRTQAEELFLGLYQGQGYRNTSGLGGALSSGQLLAIMEGHEGKAGTYH